MQWKGYLSMLLSCKENLLKFINIPVSRKEITVQYGTDYI
uniref:Uncharacterized protein n=1 Tax=Setaria italica TaxID=4555 RepID=K3ZGL2_SETIT